jgi:hypothetical protein
LLALAWRALHGIVDRARHAAEAGKQLHQQGKGKDNAMAAPSRDSHSAPGTFVFSHLSAVSSQPVINIRTYPLTPQGDTFLTKSLQQ